MTDSVPTPSPISSPSKPSSSSIVNDVPTTGLHQIRFHNTCFLSSLNTLVQPLTPVRTPANTQNLGVSFPQPFVLFSVGGSPLSLHVDGEAISWIATTWERKTESQGHPTISLRSASSWIVTFGLCWDRVSLVQLRSPDFTSHPFSLDGQHLRLSPLSPLFRHDYATPFSLCWPHRFNLRRSLRARSVSVYLSSQPIAFRIRSGTRRGAHMTQWMLEHSPTASPPTYRQFETCPIHYYMMIGQPDLQHRLTERIKHWKYQGSAETRDGEGGQKQH
ncbi:hypothetical protein NMY22_g8556 [Coprinellus aureogranulatus]|nr:hypothetical protein NMY22_g8556 [Coprinellus aureogranulatus]